MGRRDKRIDAYIARAPEFARPILTRIRTTFHAACPEVQETLKWGAPAFEYHGLLAVMASFRQHAALNFWKGKLIVDANGRGLDDAFGQFGRITSVKDLPAKPRFAGYIRKAMALNAEGVTAKRTAAARPVRRMPADLAAALAKSARAQRAWEAFSPSARRDYLEWVLEAKQEATRARRVATTVEWVAAGKRRNWKYER